MLGWCGLDVGDLCWSDGDDGLEDRLSVLLAVWLSRGDVGGLGSSFVEPPETKKKHCKLM